MGKKGLLILIVVTVLVIVVAGLAVREEGDESPGKTRVGAPVVPELAEDVNDVALVRIEDGENTVTVRRQDEGWVLAERGGYPVRFEKVKETIVGASQLEIEEPKTRKPENWAALGVQDPGEGDSESKRLVFEDAAGQELASLVVGDSKYRRNSQALFVREEGDPQVWLAEGRLNVDADPKSWIETEILRVEGDRVQEVRIVHPDGEEIVVGRDEENHTQFEVENLPPEREEDFPGVANSIGSALNYLGLEDVRPAGEVDFSAEPLATTRLRTHDGLIVTVETARFEDATWARLSAQFEEPETYGPQAPDPGSAEEDAAAADGDEGGDEGGASEGSAEEDEPAAAQDLAEDEGLSPEEVRAEAEELNERLSGWAYQLPEYKVEVLTRRMEDLLKDPDAQEDEAASAAGAPLEGAPFDAQAGGLPAAGEDGAPEAPEAPEDPGDATGAGSDEPETHEAPAEGGDGAEQPGGEAPGGAQR